MASVPHDPPPADQRLRQSEDAVPAVLDCLPVRIAITQPDGQVKYLNRAASDAFGVSLATLREQGWKSAVVAHQADTVTDRWELAARDPEPFTWNQQYICSDGEYRWWRTDGQPMKNSAGAVVCWYVVFTDVSGPQPFESAKKGGSSPYDEILGAVPAILWCATASGELVFTNRANVEFTGVTDEELAKENFAIVHPDDVSRVLAAWGHSLKTGEPYRIEHRMRAADGTYRWFYIAANPVRDENGKILRWFGYSSDIHDLRTAQAALQESAERFNLIVDTIPIGVWSADSQGQLTFNNAQTRREFGLTQQDGSDWNRARMVHPDDLERVSRSWAQSVATGEPYRVQARHRHPSGNYRWTEVHADPLRDGQGKIKGWYAVNIDIEDSKRLEAEAREARRRFEQATRIATIAELSASIAHEINQPLTAVVSNASACQQWLSADPPNLERARVVAEEIERSGLRAAEIVQRIRSLFKRAPPTMASLDVNEVINQGLELVKHVAEREHVGVRTELASDLRPACADRLQLQQVVSNLAQNAIDAMSGLADRPRQLVVRSRSSEDLGVVVELCDNGSGLEYPDRVFESFHTTKPNGMGMGLAICRSIIESHGGRVWAKANAGHGTTFSFTLPGARSTTSGR